MSNLKIPSDNDGGFDDIKSSFKGKKANRDNISDITNQLLIKAKKQTFEDMGVSDNTLTQLTKVINDSNNCDSECRKRRELNTSKDTLMLAIQLLNGAPKYFDVSEKNYLIKKYGKSGYVNYMVKNATEVINNYTNNQKQLNDKLQFLINNMVSNYSYNVDHLNNIIDSIKTSKKTLNGVDTKINNFVNVTNLDKRVNFYQSKDLSSLRNYNYYITILYYLLFIAFLLLKSFYRNFRFSSEFTKNFNINNLKYLTIFLTLCFLPYLLKVVIIHIIHYYELFTQYINVKKFDQSYQDILMDSL